MWSPEALEVGALDQSVDALDVSFFKLCCIFVVVLLLLLCYCYVIVRCMFVCVFRITRWMWPCNGNISRYVILHHIACHYITLYWITLYHIITVYLTLKFML